MIERKKIESKVVMKMLQESHYLETKDCTLIYYEKSGQGAPLFLLHGNGGHGGYFSGQIQSFAEYFTVYVIDSRSHGRSTNAREVLDFPLMANDLLELMLHENLEEISILGFSDGANLALVFSILYPERVNALVLNAGNTLVSGIKLWGNLATRVQYIWFRLLSLFQPKYKKNAQVVKLMMHDIGVAESQLDQISCPVLIIVGSRDVVKLSHSKYLARAIKPASFIRMARENHFYAKRNPASFNHEVLVFLKNKQVIK